jgi:transposase
MQGEVSMNQQEATKRRRERTPNNRTTTGYRISDELWEVLQPLLPTHVNTHRFGGGRPRVPDRDCADAIFYVLRTGCQWQALDQTELCSHSTAHDRFQEWVEAGVFLKLWQAGVEQFDELCGIGVCQVVCVTNLVCKRFSCSDPSALDTFWAFSIAKDNNQLLDAIK